MAANGARSGHDRIMGHRQDLTLLSERIYHLRCGAGLTQEALAGWIGVTPAAVRSYEAGRAAPRPAHLEAMAEALGVRPEHLVTYRIDAGDTLASALFQLGDTYGLDPVWYEGRAYLVPTSRFMAGTLSTWANWHEALRAGAVSREEYDAWRRRFAAPFDALDCHPRREESRERPAAGHRPGPTVLQLFWLWRHGATRGLTATPPASWRSAPPLRPLGGRRDPGAGSPRARARRGLGGLACRSLHALRRPRRGAMQAIGCEEGVRLLPHGSPTLLCARRNRI